MTPVVNALYSKFTGDTGASGLNTLSVGGFHNADDVPQGTARPFTTYQVASATPEYVFTDEYWRRLRVFFKCYGAENQGHGEPGQMADRIEMLLTDGTMNISGWVLKYMRLVNRQDLVEKEDAISYPFVLLDYAIEIART